ncbi:peptide methionine sulfoxide reductase MsrA [Nonlabens ulvanivorans]|nr:peptide methionine sulfoxide reductase MsrA [Nonlabens ulvanivorans]
MKLISTIILIFIASTCNTPKEKKASQDDLKPIEVISQDGLERAYFASGCFWCVEEIYESVKGVDEAFQDIVVVILIILVIEIMQTTQKLMK